MNLNYRNHNEHGMTLIEILIAMSIGVVLLSGIISIFISSKQTYRMQEALSRLQENGRFAIDFIGRDLRMADSWGCMRRDSGGPINFINPAGTGYDAAVHDFFTAGGLDGSQGTVDGGGNSGLDAPDSLTIRGVNSAGVFLTTASANATAVLTATAHGFVADDFLFVTDCHKGDIFQASSVTANTILHAATGSPGNNTANFSIAYGTDAQVYKVSTIVYTIAAGASGLNSLFRSTNGTNQELIEGVENMQILFGVDNDAAADGIPNFYVPFDQIPTNIPAGAGNPPGRNRVVSIRISLLLQSTNNNLAPQNISVAYNGDTSAANRRLKKVVTSTIALRNR